MKKLGIIVGCILVLVLLVLLIRPKLLGLSNPMVFVSTSSVTTSTVTEIIGDPQVIPIIVASNYITTYSDDLSRILNWGQAQSQYLSLRSEKISDGNTELYTQVPDGTFVPQHIQFSLANFGSTYARGAITFQGYHYIEFVNPISTSTDFIKRCTSSWDYNIADPDNWVTTTIIGHDLGVNGSWIIGATGNEIYFGTSTTEIITYTIDTSTNSLTYARNITITGAANTSGNSRVNDDGIHAYFAGFTFRDYDTNGVLINGRNATSHGGTCATAGTCFFATQHSTYLIPSTVAPTTLVKVTKNY